MSYGFAEYSNLSPQQVLQKISQQAIFEWILEEPFSFSKHYKSPFRTDNRPGCTFGEQDGGNILFQDFAEVQGKTHRSCFKMVMDKYNVPIKTAIDLICEHFEVSKDTKDYTQVLDETNYTKKESEYNPQITFVKRPTSKQDRIYWAQFIITEQNLIEDNVFSTSKFSFISKKGKRIIIKPYGLCYAIDFLSSVKIYQPYSKDYKWLTNCSEDDIGNIDNLPASGDKLIVAKSYKDHRVLRNVGYENVIWFQNEGCVPNLSILINLISRFKEIVFFYDNDTKGIEAAIKLVGICNGIRDKCSRTIHLPTWKDSAEYVHKEGRRDLIKVLKEIRL